MSETAVMDKLNLTCDRCGYRARSAAGLKVHRQNGRCLPGSRQPSAADLTCERCGCKFRTQAALDLHHANTNRLCQRYVHDPYAEAPARKPPPTKVNAKTFGVAKRVFRCRECGAGFQEAAKCRLHVQRRHRGKSEEPKHG